MKFFAAISGANATVAVNPPYLVSFFDFFTKMTKKSMYSSVHCWYVQYIMYATNTYVACTAVPKIPTAKKNTKLCQIFTFAFKYARIKYHLFLQYTTRIRTEFSLTKNPLPSHLFNLIIFCLLKKKVCEYMILANVSPTFIFLLFYFSK